jgi:D-amino-acid dehydrogenase
MFQPDAPLRFKPWRWDPPLWSWGLRFLANCTTSRARANMDRTLRVALYSRAVMGAMRQRLPIAYNAVLQGILHIYRTPAEFEDGKRNADALGALGLPQDVLTPADCVRLEPALAHAARHDLVGGLMSPADESGDAKLWSDEMTRLAAAKGAVFRWGESVRRLAARHGAIERVVTDRGEIAADAFVLALGSYSPLLARDVGLKLPIYPAKGYSISVDIEQPAAAPTISVTDETRFMVFSRLGNVMRVAGTAELAGWDTGLDPVRVEPLVRNAKTLFPAASAYRALNPWCGLRPATPDSVPLLGATPISNLLLNTGHGTLGWTMAAGSARVIADLIAGRKPEIDLGGLGLDRF